MEQRVIHKYYADSIEKVLHYVDEIGKAYKECGKAGTLWFRGQEFTHYNLEPNIFRQATYQYNSQKT